jgi:hypothetical protein
MTIWDLRTFRNDLSMFINILSTHNVKGDFSELTNILNDLNTKSKVDYKFQNLAFYIKGRIAGTVPDKLDYCQVFLDNTLQVRTQLDVNLDPLYIYKLDLIINVYKSETSTEKSYSSTWHLDRHPDAQNVKYTHPFYHFQFGGKKLDYIDTDMSILSCPRIPHPPMDLFLATHFILNNFFNNRLFPFVNSMLADFDYQQIIKRAQERLWTPYFKAYDSTNINTDFTINKIFPLYLN